MRRVAGGPRSLRSRSAIDRNDSGSSPWCATAALATFCPRYWDDVSATRIQKRAAKTDGTDGTYGTDKVTNHNYDTMYTKYFETMHLRRHVDKMLEIGLGCTMAYGAGASAALWREYLPHARIWEAEYNAECVEAHAESLRNLSISVLTGDQSDSPTLYRWIEESGGNFDVIIDDGGHSNMQQYNSFVTLFVHGLKPGGVYFLEDLLVARTWVDGDKKHVMVEVIKGAQYGTSRLRLAPYFDTRAPPPRRLDRAIAAGRGRPGAASWI